MEILVIASQIIVALGLLNVWLLRTDKATEWRGGDARSMREEFAAYGLPGWAMWVVGFLKVTFAVLLIIGIWVPVLVRPAAIGIAILMVGAVAMHFKVGDPPKKSLPAAIILVLTLVIILLG
jgi:uncharacterized membrane protein YphA (DoxX/SURF4 family)